MEEDEAITFSPNPFAGTSGSTREVRRRDWDDTLAVRTALEGDIGEHWVLSTGLGWEPSPVPSETADPGFPRGDAIVAGLGISYQVRRVSLDLGYSFYFYDDRSVRGQELENPNRGGTYEARDQVWAFSASFHR